jgi:hypothetical protein
MNSNYYSLFAIFAVVLTNLSINVHAQQPPCPPDPSLETIVNTPEKCNCFYALLFSGLDLADASTFGTVFADDSVQNVAQTGQYVGADGIAEYLSWVKGGESGFVTDYIQVGTQLILDMTGTTQQQCAVTVAERRHLPLNPLYTDGNQDVCVEIMTGSSLLFTINPNPGPSQGPITVSTVNAWIPDGLASSTVQPQNQAVAEYVCDTIVNTCGYDGKQPERERKLKAPKMTKSPKKTKATKKTKKTKKTKAPKKTEAPMIPDEAPMTPDETPIAPSAMENCLAKYNALPSYGTDDPDFPLAYLDGNTQGCRVIHSVFARTNSDHCPHISFEADEDINGLVKCNESKKVLPSDLFTQQQLGMFMVASNMLGLGDTAINVNVGSSC